MFTPDSLEGDFTLLTAAARYDELRVRDALAPAAGDATGGEHPDDPNDPADPETPSLTRDEVLELLALGEVVARKAGYGRQLAVRSARAVGASWSQIGAALGTSKQAAWEAHGRWIDDQAEQHRLSGYEGMSVRDAAAARALAGAPDGESEA
ncbi:hypothetical protein GCM10022252_48430 [Streptosporangium oxazolinicum]|uniref:Uncharacterized protein n=1 Tax=Streptosporangium oxazolinicum TaxID=909287 RepID=A0ABP8B5A0_9ACTN